MSKKDKPDAELIEMDTREVSIVDKPAIKRKFLIVKSQDGTLGLIRMEDQQMTKANEAINIDEDILDLLDIGKSQQDDSDVVTATTATVDRLMKLATMIKKDGGDAISTKACDELCFVASGLMGKAVDKEEVAKLSPAIAEERVNTAVGQMMAIVNILKDDASADITKGVFDIASKLAPVAKEQDTSNTKIKIFVSSGDEDPEILIQKAGAKMKSSRLSAFEKAVNTLVTLLNEIKGEQPNKDKTKKSNEEDPDMSTTDKDNKDTKDTKTTEAEAAAKAAKEKEEAAAKAKADAEAADDDKVTKTWVKEQIGEAVTKGLESVTTSIKELGEKFEKAGEVVTSLTKKVDEMDAAPAGEGDDSGDGGEGDPTEKKDKKSFWGGRFLS
jgi:hypothetical protein